MRIALLLMLLPMMGLSQQKTFSLLKICGHRGGFYDRFPENSLSLFDYTARQFRKDTVMLEIDIRKSKEGTLYILHDETLDRTTTGAGRLDEQSDAAISTLFLKKENGQVTKERIPTFTEFLQFARKKNITLMLDIKTDSFEEALKKVRELNMAGRTLVLTFRWDYSEKVAGLQAGVYLSCLVESSEDEERLNQLPLPITQKVAYVNRKTTREVIDRMKRNGISIMADVSENQRYSGKPLSAAAYQTIVRDNLLNILITDFPAEARDLLMVK